MVAVVEVDSGQPAKRSKATDEEGKTPPQPVEPVRKQRQPTPDHPPYCWMISEAIDALGEDGGSEEDSISAFIRARYPGVPAAHDRLLRHYLDKHVAEGFFVCNEAGRYLRSPEEDAVVEPAAAGSSEVACVGSLVVEAKRGRGRPRKDASTLTSPAGKKDGARSAIPKRRGLRRAVAGLVAANDSVPASPVAVADKKDGSQAALWTPTRRGQRLSAAQQTAAEDPVLASPKDGSQAALSTPKRRGLRRATAQQAAAEDPVPWSPVPVPDTKDGSQAASSTPKRRGRRRATASLAAAEDPVPTSPVAIDDKKDGSQAAFPTPRRCGRLRKLGMVRTIVRSCKALVPGKKESSEVSFTMDKEHEPPRELALVIVGDGAATTSIMDMACANAPPTMPVPAPTPAMDKDGRDAPSFNLALSSCPTSTAPESGSRACEPTLVVSDDGSVPVLVADKKDGVGEAPAATYKPVHQPLGSAPTAGKKAGSKALSSTPKCRRQCKSAAVSTRENSALTPVAGKKAGPKVSIASTPVSVADQDGMEARKLYPVTADEIPDDPACCLLALPSQTPAAVSIALKPGP